MKYFRITALVLTALFAINGASAQGLENKISVKHPDFSGKWQLDRSNSVQRDSFILPVFGLVITIEQGPAAIRFKYSAVLPIDIGEKIPDEELTLFTDGRGDKYPEGVMKVATTTSWQGNKLLITHRNKADVIVGYERYEISANGRTLKSVWLRPDGSIDSSAESTTFQRID